MSRLIVAAGALALSGLPALAGEFGCVGNCYTPAYVPPTYGTVTERVMVRAPETYAITQPAEYRTVYDTVQTGGGRYWSVTRDPMTGRLVGCWITRPVTYASVPRTVMVRPPQVIPYAVPAQFGYRSQVVQTSPGYKAWAPISRPVAFGGGDDLGGGYGGYGGGAGFGGGFAYGGGYRHGGAFVRRGGFRVGGAPGFGYHGGFVGGWGRHGRGWNSRHVWVGGSRGAWGGGSRHAWGGSHRQAGPAWQGRGRGFAGAPTRGGRHF